TKIRFSFAS
ncbi:hypothetical protein D041_0550B, partial [Vibrio parahaemolyticus EKP-008]